ncbi:conserved hypothetical protein [Pyrenophora tritici-repentis Pt-1C-BFP]|uniref:CorA, Mg2+ and Co2+ transporter n=1 Tax=Pyrenophora tritici-repentis (strain Pt-1C-BFP) TaxID=426418 RepID=B2W6V2_PYRTR|nr:uncharacterized protein PTRG_05540 [Pyrenophora tritici-repentis Pt-1C-BFP]EDU48460.1 conserved hypothetical protein [Pyrenophora tritici-repentis Pt-1C-BFP]
MVFFMATERAVHYGTEVLRDQELIDYMAERSYFPGSEKEMDEGVVKRLGEVARRSLRRVRFKLCGMVKSDPPLDIFRKKSLGPDDLLDLCRPLSDRTKQILEINEEDHGKAIMVFTVVTVIFLPLSFATSYFGMNTSDIRDMDQTQTLFWSVAIPLTVLTVGGCMLIGYNGVELLDGISSFLRMVSGKQKESPDAGVGVSRRKPPPNLQFDTTNTQELTNLDEAEFANPRPSGCDETMEDIQANKDYASIRKKIPAANFSHERNGLPPLPPRIDIVPGTMGAGWDKQDAWYDMKEKELWQRNRRSHRKVDNNYYENYGRY